MGEPAIVQKTFFRHRVHDLAQLVAFNRLLDSSVAPITGKRQSEKKRGWQLWKTAVSMRGPQFGRRSPEVASVPAAASVGTPAPASVVTTIQPTPAVRPGQQAQTHASVLVDLRSLCLARMDPVAVAQTPPDRLVVEVERLIAEIATERRIQLNGREQRGLAGDLVHDMIGLGPLETLLEDDLVADIMVNGPFSVFVERRGKMEVSKARFRDAAHLANVCQRIAAGSGGVSTKAARWLMHG